MSQNYLLDLNKIKDAISSYFGLDVPKSRQITPASDFGSWRDEKEVLEEYLACGVLSNKVILTKDIAVATWKKTEKKILKGSDVKKSDLYKTMDGWVAKGSEDNVMVPFSSYTDLDQATVNRINNSEGIIATTHTYQDQKYKYRFGFIPQITE